MANLFMDSVFYSILYLKSQAVSKEKKQPFGSAMDWKYIDAAMTRNVYSGVIISYLEKTKEHLDVLLQKINPVLLCGRQKY